MFLIFFAALIKGLSLSKLLTINEFFKSSFSILSFIDLVLDKSEKSPSTRRSINGIVINKNI